MIENNNPDASYLVTHEQFALSQSGLTQSRETGIGKVVDDSAATNAGYASIVLASPLLAVLSGNYMVNADNINQNFREMGLHSNTVSPKETAHGFIYFNLPDSKQAKDSTWAVLAKPVQLQSRKSTDFNINFNW